MELRKSWSSIPKIPYGPIKLDKSSVHVCPYRKSHSAVSTNVTLLHCAQNLPQYQFARDTVVGPNGPKIIHPYIYIYINLTRSRFYGAAMPETRDSTLSVRW